MQNKTRKISVTNIDAYIALQPRQAGAMLKSLREVIQSTVPEAEEVISYQIPAFKYHGMLVYFAAFKNHIGFYPRASAIKAFTKELAKYECAKGTVRFPLDKPLPINLIKKIVKFRKKENINQLKNKVKK